MRMCFECIWPFYKFVTFPIRATCLAYHPPWFNHLNRISVCCEHGDIFVWQEAEEYQDFGKEVFWKGETQILERGDTKLKNFSTEFLLCDVDLTELFHDRIIRMCSKFPPGFERHILGLQALITARQRHLYSVSHVRKKSPVQTNYTSTPKKNVLFERRR